MSFPTVPTEPCSLVQGTPSALLTRLSEHNCGNGSDFTKTPHRLPWAVAAFVCNFSSSFSRRDFENELHREMYERRHRLKTLNDMIALFQEKVSEKIADYIFACADYVFACADCIGLLKIQCLFL